MAAALPLRAAPAALAALAALAACLARRRSCAALHFPSLCCGGDGGLEQQHGTKHATKHASVNVSARRHFGEFSARM